MRQLIKDFVEICSKTLPILEPIYEFGSLQVAGQEGFADLRPFFPGKKYIGVDLRSGLGVDVIMDLHNIDLDSESVGTVLIMDTLEHVEYPHRALKEVHRILKAKGMVIISSVMKFPIHEYPNDFWRFTPEGLKSVLRLFAYSFVSFVGNKEFPHTVIGLGFKNNNLLPTEFMMEFEKWKNKWDEIEDEIEKDHIRNMKFLQYQLGCMQADLTALERKIDEKERIISDLEFQLRAIKGTIGWQLLERIRIFRNNLLPMGTNKWKKYLRFRKLVANLLGLKINKNSKSSVKIERML